MKRRNFLGLIAVTPIAAKNAVENEAAKLVGISTNGLSAADHSLSVVDSSGSVKKNILKKFGIPDFLLDEMKASANNVTSIDPDIAVCKSISLVAKINMQKKRNFEKRKSEFLGYYADGRKEKWLKKHGIDWI